MANSHVEMLSRVLKSFADTDEQVRMVRNFTSNLETTEREQLIELAGAIYNGITYGNWPWKSHVGQPCPLCNKPMPQINTNITDDCPNCVILSRRIY